MLNEDILRSYLSIFSRMEGVRHKDDLTVTAAASLPDVLTGPPEVDTEQLSGDILEVVRLAADSFNEMRRKGKRCSGMCGLKSPALRSLFHWSKRGCRG